MLVFGPNEISKAEAKKQLEYWFERLEIQGWWNKKIKSFLRNGPENSVCSVFTQTKTINFDEPFLVLIL
jgi:ABC-2 type transport system ATP-binding protein